MRAESRGSPPKTGTAAREIQLSPLQFNSIQFNSIFMNISIQSTRSAPWAGLGGTHGPFGGSRADTYVHMGAESRGSPPQDLSPLSSFALSDLNTITLFLTVKCRCAHFWSTPNPGRNFLPGVGLDLEHKHRSNVTAHIFCLPLIRVGIWVRFIRSRFSFSILRNRINRR